MLGWFEWSESHQQGWVRWCSALELLTERPRLGCPGLEWSCTCAHCSRDALAFCHGALGRCHLEFYHPRTDYCSAGMSRTSSFVPAAAPALACFACLSARAIHPHLRKLISSHQAMCYRKLGSRRTPWFSSNRMSYTISSSGQDIHLGGREIVHLKNAID